MKKLIVFLCILGFCVNAYGDNTKRIAELQSELQSLRQNLARYNQTAQNIQIRIVQIQAVIGELQKQDREAQEAVTEDVNVE